MTDKNTDKPAQEAQIKVRSIGHTPVGNEYLPTYEVEEGKMPSVGATIAFDCGKLKVEGVVNAATKGKNIILQNSKTTLKG